MKHPTIEKPQNLPCCVVFDVTSNLTWQTLVGSENVPKGDVMVAPAHGEEGGTPGNPKKVPVRDYDTLFVKFDPKRLRDVRNTRMPWHRYVETYGTNTHYTTSNFPYKEGDAWFEPVPIPFHNCAYDKPFRARAQGRSLDPEESLLISLFMNTPYALVRVWVRGTQSSPGHYVWQDSGYRYYCGGDESDAINFAFNGNELRRRMTGTKGQTELGVFEYKSMLELNPPIGGVGNVARFLDGNNVYTVDTAWWMVNLFNNAKFRFKELKNGVWVVSDDNVGNLSTLENIQTRLFKLSEGQRRVRFLSFLEIVGLTIDNPFSVVDLDEYSKGAQVQGWLYQDQFILWDHSDSQEGRLVCYGRIPTFNDYGKVSKENTQGEVVRENYDPTIRGRTIEQLREALSRDNFTLLDVMFKEMFPDLDPADYDDEEKFLRLRHYNFEKLYPQWARSLTVTVIDIPNRNTGTARIDNLIGNRPQTIALANQVRPLAEEQTKLRFFTPDALPLDFNDPEDRKMVLKVVPKHHPTLGRENFLGGFAALSDYFVWSKARSLIGDGTLSRQDIRRMVDGGFLKHPYRVYNDWSHGTRLAVIEEWIRWHVTEEPERSRRLKVLYFAADVLHFFIPMAQRLYPVNYVRLWDWGYEDAANSWKADVGEGYLTQEQKLTLYRSLIALGIMMDTGNWLRALQELMSVFPTELLNNRKQHKNWILEGIKSRKLLYWNLVKAYLPDTGTVELEPIPREEVAQVVAGAVDEVADWVSDWAVRRYRVAQRKSPIARAREKARALLSGKLDTNNIIFPKMNELEECVNGFVRNALAKIRDNFLDRDLFTFLMVEGMFLHLKPKLKPGLDQLMRFYEEPFEITVLSGEADVFGYRPTVPVQVPDDIQEAALAGENGLPGAMPTPQAKPIERRSWWQRTVGWVITGE